MTFQSGLTTSPNDLLDKIRVFATANGWTQNLYGADAGYYRLHLQHTASGQYANLHSYSSYIYGYGSTGFNSGLAYASQPGAGSAITLSQLASSAEYYFFSGDGYIYCVVQTASASYGAFLFGSITKTCAFTGGAFFTDAYTLIMRADVDGTTNNWKSGTYGVTLAKAFYSGLTRQLDSYSPIAFNGVTTFYPAMVEIGRATPSNFVSLVGYIPDVRLLRMAGQYTNKDVVTLGTDDWMVFSFSGGGCAFKK